MAAKCALVSRCCLPQHALGSDSGIFRARGHRDSKTRARCAWFCPRGVLRLAHGRRSLRDAFVRQASRRGCLAVDRLLRGARVRANPLRLGVHAPALGALRRSVPGHVLGGSRGRDAARLRRAPLLSGGRRGGRRDRRACPGRRRRDRRTGRHALAYARGRRGGPRRLSAHVRRAGRGTNNVAAVRIIVEGGSGRRRG